jgi:3-oxoacyl-[acyl-carrier protein] reductase
MTGHIGKVRPLIIRKFAHWRRNVNETKKLAGKVALVTGASRGVGAATALRLAKDGADVAIAYGASADKAAEVVAAARAEGVKAEAFQADQGDTAQVAAMVRAVHQQFGRLDILVNNAAVLLVGQVDDPDVDLQEVADRQFAINVGGVAAATREAVKVLSDGGRIISISSVVGTAWTFAGSGDYSATKAAVAGYTRAWARELGPRGITANAVALGMIDTDMNPAASEVAAAITAQIPLGRYGRAEEAAGVVSFLAGPDASYLTGELLKADGGLSA